MDNLIVKDASFYKLCSILDPNLPKVAEDPLAKAKNTVETAYQTVANMTRPMVVPPVPEENKANYNIQGATTGS